MRSSIELYTKYPGAVPNSNNKKSHQIKTIARTPDRKLSNPQISNIYLNRRRDPGAYFILIWSEHRIRSGRTNQPANLHIQKWAIIFNFRKTTLWLILCVQKVFNAFYSCAQFCWHWILFMVECKYNISHLLFLLVKISDAAIRNFISFV